jgi:ubiquinone/menaquinone biosynthesis C-methylase UbiE
VSGSRQIAVEAIVDERLHFPEIAAAGYDDHVGRYTAKLVPRLLEIGRLRLGQAVLDVATGTGIAACAAAEIVGTSGKVIATDISPHMLDRARQRLASFPNASFFTEDGQALSFADQSFDTVICNMGLMYFPDPHKGIKEFNRVLRSNGRVTVTDYHGSGPIYRLSSGREFGGVGRLIATINPSKALHGGDFTKLGSRIADLFAEAGFRDIKSEPYSGLLVMPSLDGYVRGIEAGAGAAGAEFRSLAPDVRETVRGELHDLLRESNGEEVHVTVPVMFASGVR